MGHKERAAKKGPLQLGKGNAKKLLLVAFITIRTQITSQIHPLGNLVLRIYHGLREQSSQTRSVLCPKLQQLLFCVLFCLVNTLIPKARPSPPPKSPAFLELTEQFVKTCHCTRTKLSSTVVQLWTMESLLTAAGMSRCLLSLSLALRSISMSVFGIFETKSLPYSIEKLDLLLSERY